MKSSMKKIAAGLIALLMMIQIVPVFGETYSSGMIVGTAQGYKEALEIVASKGTYVLLGQTLELDVNEDYSPEWSSEDEGIVTVDENGILTAIAEGTATVIATEGTQTAKIEVTVIDPEPILTEDETKEDKTAEETADEQTSVSSGKKAMVIVINGENERVTYDGEEHLLDRFVATGSDDSFDESRIAITGELGVKATDCGFYELQLDGLAFTYDDPDVEAHFVINNSFLKITPAAVTVAAEPAEKEEGGEDPELKATVTGLFGEDTVEYTLTREEGEEPGLYVIRAEGEEAQGNYRVEFTDNVMTITERSEEEAEEEEKLTVWITSLHPADEPVYFGTEITLEAHVAGAEEGEYTIQWQYSEDYENWIDIPGANGMQYTFSANGENVTYAWRAVANKKQ